METVPCIDKLSFRDIRPHVQILIRQSLEMLFTQIIGYKDIVDSKGNRIKKITQIGVEFLSKYRDKQDILFAMIMIEYVFTYNRIAVTTVPDIS